MKQTTYHCDYCGVKINKKNNVKNIKTIWKIFYVVLMDQPEVVGGDGCIDCYKSYLEWIKSRERHSTLL